MPYIVKTLVEASHRSMKQWQQRTGLAEKPPHVLFHGRCFERPIRLAAKIPLHRVMIDGLSLSRSDIVDKLDGHSESQHKNKNGFVFIGLNIINGTLFSSSKSGYEKPSLPIWDILRSKKTGEDAKCVGVACHGYGMSVYITVHDIDRYDLYMHRKYLPVEERMTTVLLDAK